MTDSNFLIENNSHTYIHLKGPDLFQDLAFFMNESLNVLFFNDKEKIIIVKNIILKIINNTPIYKLHNLTMKYGVRRLYEDDIEIIGLELIHDVTLIGFFMYDLINLSTILLNIDNMVTDMLYNKRRNKNNYQPIM